MKRILIPAALLFAVTTIVLVACNNPEKETNPTATESSAMNFDLAKAKKAVEDANTELMGLIKRGDSVEFANHYTTDAKIMGPGGPVVVGKNNIRGFLHALAIAGIKDFRLKTVDVWGSNDLLSEEGNWSLYDDKGVELDHGKYVVLWKQEDGKWKLFRDCWNSDVPPAASK